MTDENKEKDSTVRPQPLDPQEVQRARERTEAALERMREARARVESVLRKARDNS
jgi:hypothetical protein